MCWASIHFVERQQDDRASNHHRRWMPILGFRVDWVWSQTSRWSAWKKESFSFSIALSRVPLSLCNTLGDITNHGEWRREHRSFYWTGWTKQESWIFLHVSSFYGLLSNTWSGWECLCEICRALWQNLEQMELAICWENLQLTPWSHHVAHKLGKSRWRQQWWAHIHHHGWWCPLPNWGTNPGVFWWESKVLFSQV